MAVEKSENCKLSGEILQNGTITGTKGAETKKDPPAAQQKQQNGHPPKEADSNREVSKANGHVANGKVADSQDVDFDPDSVPTIIVWRNVAIFVYLHVAAVYGFYLFLTSAMWTTRVYTILLAWYSGLGITAGAHRLWSHKAYKAKLPFRIFLGLANTVAAQNSIYEWSRDHRVHHKYSETHGDPHNATRGFFFSHVGWLLCKKHPYVKSKGKAIDMSDLLDDPVVTFQMNNYKYLVITFAFVVPAMIPMLFWGETFMNAFFCASVFRYAFILNCTWLVNSAAHMWGNKPYDKFINPAENASVAFFALGEGWHNYHHVFPWDYKTAELGSYGLNWTSFVIDFMNRIGQTYDLKTVNPEVIKKRVLRTGDGSHPEGSLWGWGDKDMKKEDFDSRITKDVDEALPVWGWEDKDNVNEVGLEVNTSAFAKKSS